MAEVVRDSDRFNLSKIRRTFQLISILSFISEGIKSACPATLESAVPFLMPAELCKALSMKPAILKFPSMA